MSFVEILVNETSDVGQTHLLDGGIGYPNVSLAVEAFDTLKLDYGWENQCCVNFL